MISVIIPTYNHGKRLSKTLDRMIMEFKSHQDDSNNNFDYEIIVVNDGSHDCTRQIIKEYVQEYQQIRGIILSDNVGQQNATLAGLRHAKYDYVFTYDDDLKYDPSSIFQLTELLDKGADVVYGYIQECRQKGMRYTGSRFKEWVFYRFLNKPKDICLTSYRGMQRSLVDYVIKDQVPHVYISARILQITKRIEICEVDSGETNPYTRYNFKKLVLLLTRVVLNYTIMAKILPRPKNLPQYIIKEILE